MISGDTATQPDEIDLIAVLRVAWRLKYLIAGIAALFGLAAVILALTATPIFRSQVVVAEVNEGNMNAASSLASQFGGLANLAGVSLPVDGIGREARAILKSRRLAREFIETNGLLAELSPAVSTPPSLWSAVNRFRESVLTINEDATEGITTVSIDWTDPAVAASWANGFVTLANELIRTRALEEANRNIDYLNKQIERTNVVEVQRVMYNLIESETKTLMLANARAEYAFTIVDPAVMPEKRRSPRRKLMVLSGSVIGLFVGTIVALAYNLWRRIRAGE